VRQAVRTGLGLKAKINERSVFDRKNYFYPDLPQGYQISQYKSPIVGEGEVVVDMPDGETVRVGIERLHLEQDAGKLLHDQHATMSLVDLNRSGVALMEIVTKPDLRSAEEAKAFLTKLRLILQYLGTCDGDMEKGHLRADVNVSVRKPGAPLGTRCEIKNLNSIRFIGQAIEHEAWRQIGVIEEGGAIEQETRLFDPDEGETRSMRSKEEAHDYRYFPDPDLLPLELAPALVAELRATLPELPDEKRSRFVREYIVKPSAAEVLVADSRSAQYFQTTVEKAVEATVLPKGQTSISSTGPGLPISSWVVEGKISTEKLSQISSTSASLITTMLFGRLNETGLDIGDSPVKSHQMADIVGLVVNETISTQIAKEVFEIVWNEGGDPRAIVETRGLKQVTDVSALEKLVDDIVAQNPDKVGDAKANPKAIGWFVGQVMKASGGKANPQAVNELLKKRLGI
jgi:aspartyl-tRNA(Asn)/glutamyl-tRNA(Gln) amidotransferase subunit B